MHHPFSTTGTLTAHFKVVAFTKEGAITNVYGPQSIQDKKSFMQTLQYVKTLIHTPHWIGGGDFNMILTLEEQNGWSRTVVSSKP